MRVLALSLGFTGSIFAFVDATHFAAGFGAKSVKLGLGQHSWLWWNCGTIGFAFIIAAFVIELINHCISRSSSRPALKMRDTKRSGWIRIGIVLSLLWMFALVLTAVQEFRAHRVSENTFVTWKANTGEDLSQVRSTSGQFADLVPLHAALTPRFFGFLVIPVALGWAFAFIVVYAVLWVSAGFRARAPNQSLEPTAGRRDESL